MNVKQIMSWSVGGVIALLALVIIGGSFYQVDEGERGVILRNGKVVGTAEPGLNFKYPIIDSVKDVNVQSQTRIFKGVQVYSRDSQNATLVVSVNYRLASNQVEKLYGEFGGEEGILTRLLDRQLPDEVKNVMGQFAAVTAIQERTRLGLEVAAAIKKAAGNSMLIIESVQIENIDFSDAYEKSIEQRMLAEVEVQKVQQNAEREKVQAEIAVIQAKAEADAVKLKGDAEAHAINARGKALRDNPALIGLVQAEKWDGKLPTTMVPGQTVPFINVK
jgi:regulator of protease activity HflC (stomatin/prohibitin superfamily)